MTTLEKNGIADIHIYLNENLVETALRLSRAAGFLGNDSGLSHLAAFVGQSTVTIFGPSDHRRWCPIGPRVIAVIPESSCPPCFEIDNNNCDTMDCFNNISVDNVIKVIKTRGFI